MKKYIILHIALTITFMAFSCHSVSQNLTDPYYIDQNVLNIGTYVNTPSYSVTREYPINNPTNIQIYNSGNSDYNLNSGQFTGEYMIMLYKSIGNLWINELIQNHGLTYKMELVSFPFCMTCWDIGGCAGLTNQRNLNMPDEIYNANSKKWGYLTNIRDGGTFDNQTNFLISGEANVNPPETLVSATFLNSGITDYSGRNYLPHSVIRHVIYIHCNTNTSSTIIDSLVWIYDNTRGRMRSYPFIDQNVTGNGGGIIDVMFTPELIIKPFHAYYGDISGLVHHNYDESTNSGWIDGGTINYFDFINASASCTSATGNYFPSNQSDEFYLYDANSPTLYHLRPPVYGILNSILRCGHGSCPAGYAFSNSIPPTMSIPTNSFIGIRQNYFIDRNINFTVINNYDKTLYNPSEVTIDPDAGVLNGINPPIEVVFPESYTFKTILGRSPSFQEVLDAGNDPQNGYHTDLKQIPVPVDAKDWPWSTANASDYPELMWDDPTTTDANGFYSDERFGYYYIANKATLTIENCVKLFDARFAVNPGGTMKFSDYSQILGYEDKVNNNGRYKIRGEGGAILRNFSQVQYVQNGDIFQSIPLNYIATSNIIAGENVDPDTDQPTGIYEIKAGADVTFTAGDYIQLKDGFYVSGGNFHAIINENLPVPAICYANNGQNGGNRVQQQANTLPSGNSNFITVAPNPNQGYFTFYINGVNSMKSISLFDLTGRSIYHKNDLNEKSHEVRLAPNIKGLIVAKIVDNKGEIKMLKVVIE